MSLFKNLLQTYEKCGHIAGVSQPDSSGEVDERKTFLPIFHTTFKAQIFITLNGVGELVNIEQTEEKIIIVPCSEQSLNRSSGLAAHPLCDQLGYIDKDLDPKKHAVYLLELEAWKNKNQKLQIIYNFVRENSISKLLSEANFGESKALSKEKLLKAGVGFSVILPNDYTPNVWEDKELQDLWISIQTEKKSLEWGFDYLSGNDLKIPARMHPKKINLQAPNAKLISCNDESGFTYRGRFTKQEEAMAIDAVTSQKTHQTLSWLISNIGQKIDTQVTVIWAVDEPLEKTVSPHKNSIDLFGEMSATGGRGTSLQDAYVEADFNYSRVVGALLKGMGKVEHMQEHGKKIVIAIFDAATTGRMNAVFYQELPKDTYLENIANWHYDTSWHLTASVKTSDDKKAEYRPVNYIGCPSFFDIFDAVWNPRRGRDAGTANLRKKVQKQLLECMFGNFSFPHSYVLQAAYNVSNPMTFVDSNGAFSAFNWRQSLNTACALYKKYHKQQKKEEISMELERTRTDRDYLYGRLLSVADRIEQVSMGKADKDKRTTNAVRLMSMFSVKPYSTWGVLRNQLNPYINQLDSAGFYLSIIDEITVLFKQGEFENNLPLSPLYLLGFSAQNRAFFNKNNNKSEGNENDCIG